MSPVLNFLHYLFHAYFNPLNAELNPICHLLALLGYHPILHVSRIRVNIVVPPISTDFKWFLPFSSPTYISWTFLFRWLGHSKQTAQAKPYVIFRNRWFQRRNFSAPSKQRRIMGESADARLLGLWVRIPPVAWIFFSCECCVFSDTGLCVGLITRPEESYRVCCVWVWSKILDNRGGGLRPLGLLRHSGKKFFYR